MRTILLLCIAFFLSSCSTAPKPQNYSYETQLKMQSVTHWEKLAKEVVEKEVMTTLAYQQVLNPVYVDNSDPTKFGMAFYNYLITELVNRNVILSPTPRKANVLTWGTQLVWNEKGCQWMPGVIGGAVEFVAWFFGGTSVMMPMSNLELIITTQVQFEDAIISRVTRNFYLNEDDKMNFWVGNKKLASKK